MAKKYYAIKQGKKTGIFTGQWKEIEKKYIKGFPNSEYKGFNDKKEAERYLKEPNRPIRKREKKQLTLQQVETQKKNEERRKEKEQERIYKDIMYSNTHPIHQSMPMVSIVLLGHQHVLLPDKPGYYQYILIDDKSGKHFTMESEQTADTSPNRAMIQGLIHGLSKLKFPCHVKVYSKISVGFKKMIKESNSPNADVLKTLKELLLSKGHKMEEFVDIPKVEEFFNQYKNK